MSDSCKINLPCIGLIFQEEDYTKSIPIMGKILCIFSKTFSGIRIVYLFS